MDFMDIEKNDGLIVRHNNLINANIRLDAKEYDLVRSFMKCVKKKDNIFSLFEISADDLGINYSRCSEMVKSIQRKPIEIKLSNNGIISIPFFSVLKYHNGVFEGKFNKDLKESLLNIDGDFTATFEKYILPMDSVYAKRIYELLYENKTIGYRKFIFEDLCDKLGIPKIGRGSTNRNYDKFKQKVLIVSIKEINKYSDIYIPVNIKDLKDESWVRLQCGSKRKITHLNFTFLLKEDIKKQQEQLISNEEDIGKIIERSVDIEGMMYRFPEEIRGQMFGYYHMRLIEFVEWVRAENFRPRHNDWQTSFERHCDGYRKNLGKLDYI
jgi:plasmid replication initiation protein